MPDLRSLEHVYNATTKLWTPRAVIAAGDAMDNPTVPQDLSHLLAWDATAAKWRRVQVVTGTGNLGVAVQGMVDTELPAAAALDDAITAFNVPGVGSFLVAWDETAGKWRRVRVVTGTGDLGVQVLNNPAVLMQDAGGDQVSVDNTAADGRSSAEKGLLALAEQHMFNGTTWDRVRNNHEVELWASAARTTEQTSPSISNRNHRGVAIILNITVASGTGGLTVKIYAFNSGGDSIRINTDPTARITTGSFAYIIYPGSAGWDGGAQYTNSVLPPAYRVIISVGDASSYTYQVIAQYLM